MTPAERTVYMKTYRKEHREHINETRRAWRDRNPERNKELNRRASSAHRMRKAIEYWNEKENNV